MSVQPAPQAPPDADAPAGRQAESESAPEPSRSTAPGGWTWLRRIGVGVVLAAVVLVSLPWLGRWVTFRLNHSLTYNAFVESHIVNVAPQVVSGRIVRIHASENDRVRQGEVLAEIDPVPYRDRVYEAQSQLESTRAELARQEADLDRLRREVPIRVEIARQAQASAEAEQGRAEESQRLTQDMVEKGIDEAEAAVKAAEADLTLAQAEYGRFTRLYQQEASTQRRAQQVTQARDAALANLELARARLAKALASRTEIDVAAATLEVARTTAEQTAEDVRLAMTGYDEIRVAEQQVEVRRRAVDEARATLERAENELAYTQVRAPFAGVVVHRYRHLGDHAAPGVTILSMYDPDLLYVEANLEESRLPGVAPGNPVRIDLDAFKQPFRGRVVWINKSTGAQFALMPRNVVAGEFTHVVQRVPVRIWIERDDRWPQLRAGLSAHVAIAHGEGDPDWAAQAARELGRLERRYNDPDALAPPPPVPPDAEGPDGAERPYNDLDSSTPNPSAPPPPPDAEGPDGAERP